MSLIDIFLTQKIGVVGAAYASVAGLAIKATIILALFFADSTLRNFKPLRLDNLKHFFALFQPNSYAKQIMRRGLPLATLSLAVCGYELFVNLFIGKYRDGHPLEVLGISSLWSNIATIFPVAFTISTCRYISQKSGSKEWTQIKSYGNLGFLLLFVSLILAISIFDACSAHLTRIFYDADKNTNPDALSKSEIIKLFCMYSGYQALKSCRSHFSLSIASLGDTFYSSAVNTTLIVISIIAITSISSIFSLDFYGVVAILLASESLNLLLQSSYWSKLATKIKNNEYYDPSVDSSNAKVDNYIANSRVVLWCKRHIKRVDDSETTQEERTYQTLVAPS